MKKGIIIIQCIVLAACSRQEKKLSDYPIVPVGVSEVSITDQFWLPKIKLIQDSTIDYAFRKCAEEGRMDNFLIAGGRKDGAVNGKMPFDDTDLYKIIEGASVSLISSPNPMLETYIDSIISIIAIGQEPDGYITTWFTIDRMHPPAWWSKPSVRRWQHEDTNHELYNSGHLFEAAAAHYHATGKRNLLDIAIKNADLLVSNFGDDTLRTPPGHQIVETGLIKLYQITGNEKYVTLARSFLDWRGDSATHKLYGDYSQDHLPVVHQTEAVGHAVRAEYMYAAMTDIAVMYHDSAYIGALHSIWENVVNQKMYITGGVGSKHGREAFGDNYELPNLTAYNETCAAIGSICWNQRMFLLSGDARYYDIIERTLYNGMIAGISLDGVNFFYPNPLESDGKYAFNMGSCTRQPWFDCSCCPTNLIRFVPSIPGLIYATDRNDLYINLFMSNKANIRVNGKRVEVVQQTDYPLDGKILITVNPVKRSGFNLKIRVPGWARNEAVPGTLYRYTEVNPDAVAIKINGTEEPVKMNGGYIDIERHWKAGDIVEISLPMKVRKVASGNEVTDNIGKIAIEYGPLVYCGEEADNKQLSDVSIPENTDFSLEVRTILTEKINTIRASSGDRELVLIPYYLWSNRGVGQMKVWFPLSD